MESRTLSNEQRHVADQCHHHLLQCIYAAPVLAQGKRDQHIQACHLTAAHCYQDMLKLVVSEKK